MFDPRDKCAFIPPEMSCDAHLHIFGDPAVYSYGPELRYQPEIYSAEDYRQVRNHLHLRRAVFVQPSCFGMDNRCQLDAVAKFGLADSRAVVDIADDISDLELAELHQKGARGVRINVNPIHPLKAGLAESLLPRIKRMESRCQELGWSIDFLFPDWLTTEMIPHLAKLKVNFTLAHIGMNKACNGVTSAGYQKLIGLLQSGEGYCWIKLTAPYRISLDPDYSDVVPLAQGVIAAAPNRVIWGSDYPHASFGQHNTVKIFNMLLRYAPDPQIRQRILVDNPAELYSFS